MINVASTRLLNKSSTSSQVNAAAPLITPEHPSALFPPVHTASCTFRRGATWRDAAWFGEVEGDAHQPDGSYSVCGPGCEVEQCPVPFEESIEPLREPPCGFRILVGAVQDPGTVVNQQIEEQERIAASLKYWWRWTLMIAFIGGFFGAVSSAAASWLRDGVVALIRSWWVG